MSRAGSSRVAVLVLLLPWAIVSGAAFGSGWPQWGGGPDHTGEAAAGGGIGGWEPVFQPVLAGDFVYVPGAGGTVFKLAKQSGAVVKRINPFGALDRTIFVAGGLAADASGSVIYNAMRLDSSDPWGADVRGAWLVKIAPDDTPRSAT